MSPNAVQHNLVANLITTGVGALLTVALSNFFGRLPVLLLFQTLALAFGIWNAAATTYVSYLVSRTLVGLFAIVGGGVWF